MRNAVCGVSLALAGALGLWGCGGGGGGAATPTSATSAAVTVIANIVGAAGNRAYSPNPVMANSGDTVVFKNTDSQLHHIVLDNGSADLGDLAPGVTSRGVVLANKNELRFHCALHASMVGSINGAGAPTPPCEPSPGYPC